VAAKAASHGGTIPSFPRAELQRTGQHARPMCGRVLDPPTLPADRVAGFPFRDPEDERAQPGGGDRRSPSCPGLRSGARRVFPDGLLQQAWQPGGRSPGPSGMCGRWFTSVLVGPLGWVAYLVGGGAGSILATVQREERAPRDIAILLALGRARTILGAHVLEAAAFRLVDGGGVRFFTAYQ